MSEEKIVLVTGASRGIGNAIFKLLASKGYTVYGTATTENGADKLTQYMLDSGLKGKGYVLNISDSSSIEKLSKDLLELEQSPDILINNAGITRDQLFMRISDQDWDDVINTNLSGLAKVTKAFIRPMIKKRWGRIVSVGSIVGSTGNAGQSNYCAAKAGVIGFSKALAREVASRGITVNIVSPGFIKSDMTDQLNEKQKEGILSQIPMKLMGSVDDIANSIGFLVSDEASYITGETLNVNGGMYMS